METEQQDLNKAIQSIKSLQGIDITAFGNTLNQLKNLTQQLKGETSPQTDVPSVNTDYASQRMQEVVQSSQQVSKLNEEQLAKIRERFSVLNSQVDKTKCNCSNNTINQEIDRPSHYNSKSGQDVIDVAEDFGIINDAYKFNILKYLLRSGKKDNNSELQDFMKIQVYVDRKIKSLQS